VWFAGNFLLSTGETPNFIPMQIASGFTILFSVGLLYLSKIEKRLSIRVCCIALAILYALMHFGIFLSQGNELHNLWFQTHYFLKVLVGVTAGIVLLRAIKGIENEI
jgi:membrane protease YdiL (CAAX protease family)